MTPLDPLAMLLDAARYIEDVKPEWAAAARRAVRYADSGPGWFPIETAPKDGTSVILGFWYQGRFAQYSGFYSPQGWLENSRSLFPAHMQRWFTQWHPLPAPPAFPPSLRNADENTGGGQ